MSNQKEKIKELTCILNPYDFELETHEKSGSFGEYYVTFRSPYFKLRFMQDRGGLQYMQINSSKSDSEWMPLGFIIAVIKKEMRLIGNSEADKLEFHLKNHFDEMRYFYNPKNFPTFKERLYQLARKRGFQLFPKLYLRKGYHEQLQSFKQNYPDLSQFFLDCFPTAEHGDISDSDAIHEYKKKIDKEKLNELGVNLKRLAKEMDKYWIGISVYIELAFRNINDAIQWLEIVQRELKQFQKA